MTLRILSWQKLLFSLLISNLLLGDADTTDFDLDAGLTTVTSIQATDLWIGEDGETKIDFEDANKNKLSIGKSLCSSICKISLPTLPVAPAIAILILFVIYFPDKIFSSFMTAFPISLVDIAFSFFCLISRVRNPFERTF